jgi:glycerol-3-phosphate dehydrogenase (NAD(P)+)
MNDIAVIGAGAWGTALAIHAARAGRRVALWVRDAGRAAELGESRQNPRLPNIARTPFTLPIPCPKPECCC